jgi:two-component system response regulator AtoC
LTPGGRLAIVEDDPVLLEQLHWALKGKFDVQTAGNGVDGAALIDSAPECFLIDLRLPPSNQPQEGLELLREIRRRAPEATVIVMTGEKDRRYALKAIEDGAYDFFRKPVDPSELALILGRALERQRLIAENRVLKEDVLARETFGNLVGASKPMRSLFERIEKVAPADTTVLIAGESGTGKELVAASIHRMSTRASKPFIAVNSSALPEGLAESELFGHEKGSFTGATAARPGKFELAHGGTLFLDEAATISAAVQAKLLRALESRKFERVGGTRTISVDIRLLVATNEDLSAMVSAGTFREDLFYRLNTVVLTIPPLRDRGDDVFLLVDAFLERWAAHHRKKRKTLSPQVRDAFRAYRWPGNVRELDHLIEMLTLMTDEEEIRVDHLPGIFRAAAPLEVMAAPPELPLPEAVSRFEREMLVRAISAASGVKAKAARSLGIDQNQMKYLCRKFGL